VTGDPPWGAPWDDDDGAPEFGNPGNPGNAGGASAVDAGGDCSSVSEAGSDQVVEAFFTVTNPAGTVSVTATIGGRLHKVELSANVTEMTESQLADEILVLADLAAQKAKAAQHSVTVELMRTMGYDSVVTSGFLEHDLALPSPETVAARRAEVFATRYALEDDA
jgi:ESX secretion-associated protein EspD/H